MDSYDKYAEMYARVSPALTGPTNTEYRQMKSTNEMIADLVAKGFELPPDIVMGDGQLTVFTPDGGVEYELREQRLYDQCACAFARQYHHQCDGITRERPYVPACENEKAMKAALCDGDSEAAIKALWEAVCDA